MGYYIYRYMHPDYPYLYIGKTVNLKKRINCHDNSKSDNISREYQSLIDESSVYYFELDSQNQIDYIERYLIDKYNPILNTACKDESVNCPFDISLPKWQIYRSCRGKQAILERKESALIEQVSYLSEQISENKRVLKEYESQIKNVSQQYEEEKMAYASMLDIPVCCNNNHEPINISKYNYDINYKDIVSFYQKYPQSDIIFTFKVNSDKKHEVIVSNKDVVRNGESLWKSCKTSWYEQKDLTIEWAISLVSDYTYGIASSLQYYYLKKSDNIVKIKELRNKIRHLIASRRTYSYMEIFQGSFDAYVGKNTVTPVFLSDGKWDTFRNEDEIIRRTETKQIFDDEGVFIRNEYKEAPNTIIQRVDELLKSENQFYCLKDAREIEDMKNELAKIESDNDKLNEILKDYIEENCDCNDDVLDEVEEIPNEIIHNTNNNSSKDKHCLYPDKSVYLCEINDMYYIGFTLYPATTLKSLARRYAYNDKNNVKFFYVTNRIYNIHSYKDILAAQLHTTVLRNGHLKPFKKSNNDISEVIASIEHTLSCTGEISYPNTYTRDYYV